jgi:hypothetical protein
MHRSCIAFITGGRGRTGSLYPSFPARSPRETLRGSRRRPEARDEFASAVDADLREDGLEVILERVAGNGVAGTVTLNLAGSNDSGLNLKATSTIVSATGDLAGLHGTLNLAGSVQIPQGPFGTYSGQIG